MVVYLNCEYFNSKHFTHVFIIKNSIIHIHLSDFTSKIFILFKNATCNIQIFCPFYFALQIQRFKFDRKFKIWHLGMAGISVDCRLIISIAVSWPQQQEMQACWLIKL